MVKHSRHISLAVHAAFAILTCIVAVSAQNAASLAADPNQAAVSSAAPTQPNVAIPEAGASAPLADLAAMTFTCPQAALNAAAREASKAPTLGTYQFAYFNIVSDAHHAMYEVQFRSNVLSEPPLKYCVALYCQQGWDPRTTKTEVTLMHDAPRRGRQAMHEAQCAMPPPANERRGRRQGSPR